MIESNFDYIIVGAGASGLQLAMAFVKDQYFSDKTFLLIDKDTKTTNDRTWSFWEQGEGLWDSIVHKSWSQADFYSGESDHLEFDLRPYEYKSLRSADFYAYAKGILKEHSRLDWMQGDVKQISIGHKGKINVSLDDVTFNCEHCFDSRVRPDVLDTVNDKYVVLSQHFKGWIIEFENDVFDENRFRMMDYRLRHEESTSFTYVLPYNSRQALVEFTLFTQEVFKDASRYDVYLEKYIRQFISEEPYTIVETEQGVIPMTNFPFHEPTQKGITKIGTAGSWVRPSSGYSFKYIEKYVAQAIHNIKNGKVPDHKLLNVKTRLLDSILLQVLHKENHLGPDIFHAMYAKNSIHQIFSFLDGETTMVEDIKIIGSFEKLPFLKGAFRQMVS